MLLSPNNTLSEAAHAPPLARTREREKEREREREREICARVYM